MIQGPGLSCFVPDSARRTTPSSRRICVPPPCFPAGSAVRSQSAPANDSGDSMSKELYVSSTPHETKVAVVEDDELTEIYFERENEYTLAGSIYKGRVTRVLPGMQSAFVDVGLERDAFLYVTDFLEEQEDQEEFEQVIARAHEDAIQHPSAPNAGGLGAPLQHPSAPNAGGLGRDHNGEAGGRGRGRRGRGGRGRVFPDNNSARQEPRTPEPANAPAPT